MYLAVTELELLFCILVVVQIYVTVSSGEGTKQRLQRPLRVKVIPQSARQGVSMEEVL